MIRDGLTVTEVAKAFGVGRQTVHVWLAHYERGGLLAFEDRSTDPSPSPLQMAPVAEARVPSSCDGCIRSGARPVLVTNWDARGSSRCLRSRGSTGHSSVTT